MSFGSNKKGFKDTKQFRKNILEKSNERLGLIVKSLSNNGESGTFVPKDRGMLGLLDSSYKSDVPSTYYAIHLKAIAFESARFLCTTQQVTDDLIFKSTRGEYLSQNIASFLFPGQRFSQTNSNDEKVRNFYLSIIEAYFGGSTKSNIESSLLKFLDIPVGITENFLLSRDDSTRDSIVNKFTFDISIPADDPRIKDISQLQKDIEFLLNIIKPAHTAYTTKFIFSEFLDIFRKGCITAKDSENNNIITHDGFETKIKVANTSICDVCHIDTHDYYYEDFRKQKIDSNFLKVTDELIQGNTSDGFIRQSSPRLATSIYGGAWSSSDPSIFHTRYGPFGKEDGSLADTVSDIQVYVDGILSEVVSIYPLSASFKLLMTPTDYSTIRVTYYYLKKYVGALITNNLDSVINNFRNHSTELNYKTVLFPTNYSLEQQIPLEKKYRYKGFNLFNTSILNDPLTLNMNELGLRNRINDYNVFKSHGYDQNAYVTTLVDGQELVPRSLEKKDYWRRLPLQEFRMNNNEFVMNNAEDRMYGEIHYESYHPFYSSLEYDSIDNGGTSGLVQTISEDSKEGMQINFKRLIEEDLTYADSVTTIKRDHDCQFSTFPYSGSGFASGSDNFSVLNDINCNIHGGNATWELSHPLPNSPQYHMGGKHTTMRMMLDVVNLDQCNQVEEIWEKLWDRDTSENSLFQTATLSSENPSSSGGNSSDRGYLMHTFQDALGYPNSQLEDIYPVHLDDVSREYYKEENWFLTGHSLTNDTGNILSGTKLKDSELETIFVKLTDYVPFMLNGYSTSDLQLLDTSINSFGVKVTSINNNPDVSSPLLFLTPRKILNDKVYSVYNETQGIHYNLTGMTILNNQVIDLDDSINTSPLGNGDIVRVVYDGVDYMGVCDQLISVSDADNFVLFSNVNISSVYDIFNYSRGFSYDLTGSYIESKSLIHLDSTAGMNNASGFGLYPGDIIFAKFITLNNEENPSPTITHSNNNFVTTAINIAPV